MLKVLHPEQLEPAGPPKRVAIIGAGPGGLAAAMLMAKAGADVTVYEARDCIGGRSSTITGSSAAGTFHFDCGPTFFCTRACWRIFSPPAAAGWKTRWSL